MRVAVVSNRNVPGYPAENVKDHLRWIEKASDAGAALVLFPELSLSGYTSAPFIRRFAMTLESRYPKRIIGEAKRRKMFVAFGMPFRRDGNLYLSHVLTGPDGVVGYYDKVHLAESPDVFTPGEAFKVFNVNGVSVGINICFDGRHPGSSLATAHLGAEVILHPHGNLRGGLGVNPKDWSEKKRAYLGQRAIDTCTCVLICNSVGDVVDRDGRTCSFSGGALILGPDGRFVKRLTTATRRAGMVVADLDIAKLRELRERNFFGRRRSEVYAKALARSSE